MDYRVSFMPAVGHKISFKPKNPNRAKMNLANYIKDYAKDYEIQRNKTHMIYFRGVEDYPNFKRVLGLFLSLKYSIKMDRVKIEDVTNVQKQN